MKNTWTEQAKAISFDPSGLVIVKGINVQDALQELDGYVSQLELTGGSGTPGADGESAYQIWLDAGNVGTEEEFLASLVGPEGPEGPPNIFVEGTEVDRQATTPAAFGVGYYLTEVGLWYSDGNTWTQASNRVGLFDWRSSIAVSVNLTKDNALHDVVGPAGVIPAGISGVVGLDVVVQILHGTEAAGLATQVFVYCISNDGSKIWAQAPLAVPSAGTALNYPLHVEVPWPAQPADVPVKMQYKVNVNANQGLVSLLSAPGVGEVSSMFFRADA